MKPGATLSGNPLGRRRRRQSLRPNWPVILLLAFIAMLLIALNFPLAGAVGCALVDWISPQLQNWSQ
ncbi:hypothetical protein [Ferrovibrio sp.]|uniref:hypothetical protein n=1 Tax=Ferrovibrio sp. TaxID=1917215 RepID=UPI0035B01EE4